MHRDLRPFPLADVLPPGARSSQRIMTMGVNQWDGLLSAAYAAGWILLELDEHERPVRAYQKTTESRE